MKRIGLMTIAILMVLSSCIKGKWGDPRCYFDMQNEQISVGTTTATIQCEYKIERDTFYHYDDYHEIPVIVYWESENAKQDTIMTFAGHNGQYIKVRVVLDGLKENTTYYYYYVFRNIYDSIWTENNNFKTEADNGGGEEPPTPPEIMLSTVITAEVTEITANSAQCGGEVTNDGGAEVTERGICWGTNANPTLDDSHVAAGTGMGVFTAATSGLEANTTYHVRAYAVNEMGTAYGLDVEFTTLDGGGFGEHEYVDLGLPSGTLWATCNVGANLPEERGDYFAWAETQPKSSYTYLSYEFTYGDGNTLLKYCTNWQYGHNFFSDGLTTLLPEDDAATVNWGPEWRMPTYEEWYELLNYTTHTFIVENYSGKGLLFAAPNGNSLFLPCAGYRVESLYKDLGKGYYWSSSLYSVPTSAWYLYFDSGNCSMSHEQSRIFGHSVRAVRTAKKN